MQKRQVAARTIGLVVVMGILMAGGRLMAATGEPTESDSRAEARAIEGVWEPLVTIVDCQTQAPRFSFLSMDSYIRGGSFLAQGTDSDPGRRLPGFGTWRHAGGRRFTAVYQFFTYAPDGTLLGRLKVSTSIRLSADGKSFRTTDTGEITDLNGTVVERICGNRVATRVE